MPDNEGHVRFCVRDFGEENRELCYMVNSWMDAPSREQVMGHRHDFIFTPFHACTTYGDSSIGWDEVLRLAVASLSILKEDLANTPKNHLIARIVLQHLRLDGLITPKQEKNWSWEWGLSELRKRIFELRRRNREIEEYERSKFWWLYEEEDRYDSVGVDGRGGDYP